MLKQRTSLRNLAIAAIAAGSLALPLMATAHAQQGAEGTPAAGMPTHNQAGMHMKKHHRHASRMGHRKLYGSMRSPGSSQGNGLSNKQIEGSGVPHGNGGPANDSGAPTTSR